MRRPHHGYVKHDNTGKITRHSKLTPPGTREYFLQSKAEKQEHDGQYADRLAKHEADLMREENLQICGEFKSAQGTWLNSPSERLGIYK